MDSSKFMITILNLVH